MKHLLAFLLLAAPAFAAETQPASRELITHPDPVAAGPAGRASSDSGFLRITTKPAGVSFEVLASAYETPNAEVVRVGRTPATLRNLAPGGYRVRFTAAGIPQKSASLQVSPGEETVFHREFAAGVLKVRSQPAGAEILCDDRLVGLAPATLPLLPGEYQIGARWEGRLARVRTVKVVADQERTVAFDFRPATPPPSKPPQTKTEKNLFEKTGQTLQKVFNNTVQLLKK